MNVIRLNSVGVMEHSIDGGSIDMKQPNLYKATSTEVLKVTRINVYSR